MAKVVARSHVALVLALVLGGLSGLAGCGATAHVGANRSLEIGLSEYRVTPQRVQARAGALSLFVRNLGRVSHNLTLSADGQSLATTKPIRSGQSVWLFVDLAPGSYTMASTMFSDQALGQYGTLVVSR
ncbi:MAG: hypothetical protein QOG59_616 [Solirubrobacteraceae bacterium]|jgi:hypothetical protein|nr:hypothetical protein [Solirubrobacteraceae bacterium]